jgi:hypothetical protein
MASAMNLRAVSSNSIRSARSSVLRHTRETNDTTPMPADRSLGAGQVMKAMSCAGMMTMGRIMSRSSCSRMWQWYM